jgi:O-antigen/teichoic acid export membrane protein
MFDLQPGKHHGDRRWQLLARSGAAAVTARAVGLGCMLVQVAIALRHLGPEAFGFWMTLTGAAGLLQFLDLGLGNGMQNQISAAQGTGDLEAAKKAFFCAFTLAGLLSGAWLLLGAWVVPCIDLPAVFKLQDPSLSAASTRSLWWVFVMLCVGLPLGLAQRLATALQQGWLAWSAIAIGSVASLGATALGSGMRLALPDFIGLSLLPGPLVNAFLLTYLLRRLQWRPHWGPRQLWDVAPRLLKESILFIPPQAGAALLNAAPAVILSAALGPLAVTHFNLAQRLSAALIQLHAMLLLPVWPAYAEAAAAGDHGWIRKTFRISVGYSLLFLLPCLLIGILGRKTIALWSHTPASTPSVEVLWWTAGWTFACIVGAPIATLLNALGRVKGQATYGLASALLGVALIPMFTSLWGVAGVPAALLATYVPVALPLSAWESILALRRIRAPGLSASRSGHS